MRRLAAAWLASMGLWLACWPATAADAVPLPALAGRVTDLTATLTGDQLASLEASLAAIERDKGAQLVILLLPTTQPETIEQFGIRLAEAWKVGRRGIDDGVIIIVAKDDRSMRIEVGYGLEGALPDAVAKRIVAEVMAPRFRQGDFAGGLDAAVAALGGIVGGEGLPAPAMAGRDAREQDGGMWLFMAVAFSGVLHALFGLVGSLLAAGLAGALAWWIFGSWLAVAIAALLAFVLSFARGGGGLGGGGFSSSSGGGGGFSGGGGGFGGGGASGKW